MLIINLYIRKLSLFLLTLIIFNAIQAKAKEKVTLQLKWTHAFQFAGYYAAKEQGYYLDAGLDVNFLEATPETDIVGTVVGNKAQYGVGSSGLLLARSAGKPVVVLAVIFQQSPYEIYASPEIHHLRDLIGKRLMLEPQSDELIAFLKKEAITLDSVHLVPHTFDTDGLILGNTDAMSGYLSSEPFYFRLTKYPYQSFSPRSAGIDFYGDNLFTSEEELTKHPDRVKAFRAASLRGWQYAKEHRDKVIQLILSKYSRQLSSDYLYFESDQMIPLLQPDLIDIGYMNTNRWQHIADTYASIGLLPSNFPLKGFIYDSYEKNMTWYIRIIGLAFLIILIISGIAIYIYHVNQQLTKSMIRTRQARVAQAESEELWYTIVRTSPDGIAITTPDGLITQASDKMLKMFGYDSVISLIGHNIYDFIDSSCHSKARARIEHLMGGGSVDPTTLIFVRKDGTRFHVESNVAVIRDNVGNVRSFFYIERDITERLKTEETLHENELSYYGLFNSVSEAIYIQDEQGHFIDVNMGAQKMDGYSHQDLIGKTPEFLSAPGKNNLPRIFGLISDVYKNGEPQRFEFWGKRKNGEIFPKDVICNNGKYFGKRVVITTARDVTSQKLAQETLRESEDQLSLVLKGSNLGFWDWNILTGEVKRNNRWAEMLGYSLDEIEFTVKNWDTLIHDDDRARAWKSINDHLAGLAPRHSAEYRMHCKDGSWKWISDKAKIVTYNEGKPVRMCGTHEDVTDRIQMEETLKASEEKFRELFEANLDSIIVCLFQPDGSLSNFIDFNEYTTTLTGYSREELANLSLAMIDVEIPREQMERRRLELQKYRNISFETKLRHKTGRLIDVEVKVTMINYNNQQALMSITRDITERKEAEKKLLENEALLRELNATKDKFFSIIAHDLKSPFNAIIGFSNLLTEQIKEKDYEGIEEYAEIIQSSSVRAMLLLSNLLEWSRTQTGRMDFNPEYIELISLIDEVTDLTNDFARQKSITISKEFPRVITVFADKAMISTIVRNLLSNAIKFTNAGGKIVITAVQMPDHIRVSITDNGIGIDKNAINKLFRLDHNNSTKGTNNELGTGLGLILCKEFIEKHEGTIWAESDPGAGSKFIFTIPNR